MFSLLLEHCSMGCYGVTRKAMKGCMSKRCVATVLCVCSSYAYAANQSAVSLLFSIPASYRSVSVTLTHTHVVNSAWALELPVWKQWKKTESDKHFFSCCSQRRCPVQCQEQHRPLFQMIMLIPCLLKDSLQQKKT